MKNVSIEMDDETFQETERLLSAVRKNHNSYINEAVEFYNVFQKRTLLAQQLEKESKLVQQESLKVLEEFENTDEC